MIMLSIPVEVEMKRIKFCQGSEEPAPAGHSSHRLAGDASRLPVVRIWRFH